MAKNPNTECVTVRVPKGTLRRLEEEATKRRKATGAPWTPASLVRNQIEKFLAETAGK